VQIVPKLLTKDKCLVKEHDTKDGQNGKETQLESEDIIRTT
jgi:hypothetical protein